VLQLSLKLPPVQKAVWHFWFQLCKSPVKQLKKQIMKQIVRIAAGVLFSITSLCAQTSNNTLVVFSEGGERFYLILNGLRQNDAAATNVKAVGLNQSVYKAKVIFEQKGIPDADKTMYMTWEGMDASNMEFVCSIKKDKKGKYKWSFVSTAPISASSPYASLPPSYPGGSATASNSINTNNNTQVTNANTGTTTNTTANTNGTIGMNTSMGVNDNTSNTNTTVTTTTTTTQGSNTDNVNVGMNMNGLGINMNVNISDPTLMENSQTSSTSTTTTTSYTTSSTTTSSTGNPTTTTSYTTSSTSTSTGNPNTMTTTTNYPDNSHSSMNSTANTSTGCGWAMNNSDFASAKKSIAAKSFEDSKLTVAKQILNSNCLNTSQVKEIMDQFTFEQTKLDWAKYAYTKTTDRNNYFKINDGFTFEASIDDLNDYISKQK
jgi:hypothetical protein